MCVETEESNDSVELEELYGSGTARADVEMGFET